MPTARGDRVTGPRETASVTRHAVRGRSSLRMPFIAVLRAPEGGSGRGDGAGAGAGRGGQAVQARRDWMSRMASSSDD